MPYKLTDQVEWTSQSGGYATTKRGTIIAIVPLGKNPPLVPSGYHARGNFGGRRSHESYLVAVGHAVYWPRVSHLRLSEESLRLWFLCPKSRNHEDQGAQPIQVGQAANEVDRLIEDMIAAYPKLFITRTEALHHLFIVVGCGYEWKEGRLFSGTSFPPDSIPRPAAKILAQHRARIEHPYPYPWTDQCNLALMPKDAKIEWQVAAEEIRAALRAQGYLFSTRNI